MIMLVDLTKKEIEFIMSSLMKDDTTHTELYNKFSNLSQVCTCKEKNDLKRPKNRTLETPTTSI